MTQKLTIAFISIFAACASVGEAQSERESSAEVNVTAEVIAGSLEYELIDNIRIGNMQPSQQQIYINPTTDDRAGFFIVRGQPGREVMVSYETETPLFGQQLTTLQFDYEIAVSDEEESQETSEFMEHISRILTLNEEGELYVWIGGSLNLTGAIAGVYTGDFTLEVEYR